MEDGVNRSGGEDDDTVSWSGGHKIQRYCGQIPRRRWSVRLSCRVVADACIGRRSGQTLGG